MSRSNLFNSQICCHRNSRLLVLVLVLILVLYGLSQAEGKAIASRLLEDAQRPSGRGRRRMMEEKGVDQGRRVVGSAPPRCERKCAGVGCPHCEAILVPVTAQFQTQNASDDEFLQITYARGDDLSAYKPITWKCKCGSSIFDP